MEGKLVCPIMTVGRMVSESTCVREKCQFWIHSGSHSNCAITTIAWGFEKIAAAITSGYSAR